MFKLLTTKCPKRHFNYFVEKASVKAQQTFIFIANILNIVLYQNIVNFVGHDNASEMFNMQILAFIITGCPFNNLFKIKNKFSSKVS